MQLTYNETTDKYVWVEINYDIDEVSPFFDDIHDAIKWKSENNPYENFDLIESSI